MYQLPSLPYSYNALEPYIDEETMKIHHAKHHQTYVDKLNAALVGYEDLGQQPIEELMSDLTVIPESIRTAVKNHGGGHLNHAFFWPILKKKDGLLDNEVTTAINKDFSNFDQFKHDFITSATTLFGSGWTWLVIDNGKLKTMTTPNQDSPLSQGKIPVLGLDVWEHAYYLKYQNRRPEYIDAFFHVINWEKVNENYLKAIKK
jgi:Fe-Mn family superoxide dismutase